MDGVAYKYALFFLSNPKEYYYNEIGVAFSNDLDAASWVKYPEQIVKKTWPEEGDQSLGGNAKSWGVGQPSAVSLDKGGKVLVTTLTKKMAEDLTGYLSEVGIRVQYLHMPFQIP